MAAEGRAARQDIFLDTSLIIAATVEAHPSHKAAATFVDQAVGDGLGLCISGQVCREFLVVLTRQPVSQSGIWNRRSAERVERVDDGVPGS